MSKFRVMELKPTEPPGHARRKLRGFVSEIARLRAEGYTIRAIHEALANAGVLVGWATVQREVARLERKHSSGAREHPPAPRVKTKAPIEEGGASIPSPTVDVESYFDQQTANPLFRKRGKA